MAGGIVGRRKELQVVQMLLERARDGPAAVILDGPAGIGKTTLCRAAAEVADASEFTVLTTAGAAAEMSLAWAGLSDLLAGLDEHALTGLSPLHQRAVRSVTADDEGSGGDERLVANAFRAALAAQSRQGPVLVVVDDAQWLDESTRFALGFAVRRVAGPIAVLAAYRSGEQTGRDASWVQPPDPQTLTRLTLAPLSPADIDAMVADRLGQVPPRSMARRIRTLSAGNPFYALELARAVALKPDSDPATLPPTLAELLIRTIGEMDVRTIEAMVTVVAAFEPTVDVVAAATGCSPAELVETLQPMEARGVLVFDAARIRLLHPLIASAVTALAGPAALRLAHRRLADIVDHPESRARHLALSSPHGDAATLNALDAAAEAAAARGVYTAAAELLLLAINRGGDAQWRRLRGADFHFRAGALDEAEALLEPVIDELPAGFMQTAGLLLLTAIRGYRDGLAGTTGLLRRAVQQSGEDPMLRTQSLLLLSTATGIGGDMATSVQLAGNARVDAEATGLDELRSQALAVWVSASIIAGLGFDSEAMQTALDIGDPDFSAPVMFRPTTVHAQTCAWTGRLEDARAAMAEVLRGSAERGNELDAVWAAEQLTLIEVWLGHYAEADRLALGALERARQIGGRLPLINAYTALAAVAAYRGRVDDARAAAEQAVEQAVAGGLGYLVGPPLASLAFAQVSQGRYDDALVTLAPLLAGFDSARGTEIMTAGHLPDAIVALVTTGRADDAEPLVAALEANGIRHDRPWMLAVGARSRALVVAASGDLDGAIQFAERALELHDRLPMPFERARTQLLLGQLQRRRRRPTAAAGTISRAVAVFEELGSPLWAARANRELARLRTRSAGAGLTESELKAAELAAAGLTNKAIATELYMSPKTVEMHLSSTYRKLGIRSRAQLADRLRQSR